MRELDKEMYKLTESVIGAAIEVHRHLGPGFLETVYQTALCAELDLRHIPFQKEVDIEISYKGCIVGAGRLDILVADRLVLELKAVEAFAQIHMAQLLSYLKATGLPLGLLINFNVTALKDGGIRRVILS
jgi:GxxExxY protein